MHNFGTSNCGEKYAEQDIIFSTCMLSGLHQPI